MWQMQWVNSHVGQSVKSDPRSEECIIVFIYNGRIEVKVVWIIL
jgi:hypothetical protein